jgi:2-polyprenyl-6-methoxyphenol hydroxylase-like FAD-dependent oxidoreductase
MASPKESLRDYRRDASKNWVNQTPRNVGILTQISSRRWLPKTLAMMNDYDENGILLLGGAES